MHTLSMQFSIERLGKWSVMLILRSKVRLMRDERRVAGSNISEDALSWVLLHTIMLKFDRNPHAHNILRQTIYTGSVRKASDHLKRRKFGLHRFL